MRARLAITLALLPGTAWAHLAATGLGPVYDGAWHFLSTPQLVAPLAALALFAGLRGASQARAVFWTVPPAWLAAFLAAPPFGQGTASILSAAAILASGLLLASAAPLGPRACAAAGLAIATLAGIACDGEKTLPQVAGASVCLILLLALLASLSLPLRRLPAIIAIRVAGSWTAALGLLLAGWWLHGGTP